MWLLPPDFPKRPLRLAAGCRALPWYASESEVERLLELLLRMVPEIREWVRVPWSALSRVSLGEVRAGAAIVTEAPEDLAEDEARAIAESVRWSYVFWQPKEPYERDGNWVEREVKRVLWSELQQGLGEERHPLHEQGIASLPVELAAEATDDPVELLAIVQGAVEHRLRHADDGLGDGDWRYSVRRAIGERLAERLAKVEEASLTEVLELLLTEGEQLAYDHARFEAGRRLQALGLAISVGESVALGPLARHFGDAVVYGVMLERLPTGRWPRDEEGRGFLQPRIDEQAGRLKIPPTRVPGPTAPFFAEVFEEVFEPVIKIVEDLDANKSAMVLLYGARALLSGRRISAEGGALRESLGAALLNLEEVRPPRPEQRAALALLRELARVLVEGPPADLGSFLDAVESHARAFDPPNSVQLKAVVTHCMFDHVQDQEGVVQLFQIAQREYPAAHKRNGLSLEAKIWLCVSAEALRLLGHSAKAARLLEPTANLSLGQLGTSGGLWFGWGLARARREAGHARSAFAGLERAIAALDTSKQDAIDAQVDAISSSFLRAHLSLELGHVERDRGSLTLARQWYARAQAALADVKDEYLVRYVELYDVSTHVEEENAADHEPQVRGVLDAAERAGDLRLAIFASLVLGDINLRTSRFDAARDHYRRAFGLAMEVGDLMSQANALEKQAAVEVAFGRRKEAIDLFKEVAEREAACERHEVAARLWGQAAAMSEELGRSDDAEGFRARQVEQALMRLDG